MPPVAQTLLLVYGLLSLVILIVILVSSRMTR
jgi:hypothetical protein